MRLPRPLLAAVAVVSLAFPLTACSSDDGLVIYSGRAEGLVGPLFEQFTEDTGIKVTVRYGGTAELAALLQEEGDSSPAAVFLSQDAGALGAVSDAGLLAPIAADVLDRVDAEYRGSNDDWVGVTGRARVIAYDSSQLAEGDVPGSVFDLTDPKWQGQVGIAPNNASFQTFVTAMRLAEGEDVAEQWLTDIQANGAKSYESNVPILDAVDRGEIQLGLINHYYWYEAAAERGEDALNAQIAFTDPGDPGTLVNVSGVGIVDAENPDAAALVDYLLQAEAQEYFATTTFEYPLIDEVPPADGLPALSDLQGPDVALNDLDSLAETQAMLQRVGLI